jgi:hypothetical protein
MCCLRTRMVGCAGRHGPPPLWGKPAGRAPGARSKSRPGAHPAHPARAASRRGRRQPGAALAAAPERRPAWDRGRSRARRELARSWTPSARERGCKGRATQRGPRGGSAYKGRRSYHAPQGSDGHSQKERRRRGRACCTRWAQADCPPRAPAGAAARAAAGRRGGVAGGTKGRGRERTPGVVVFWWECFRRGIAHLGRARRGPRPRRGERSQPRARGARADCALVQVAAQERKGRRVRVVWDGGRLATAGHRQKGSLGLPAVHLWWSWEVG